MRGHIAKRGKNSYSLIFDAGTDPASGKRKQQWVSVKGTKNDAEKRLSELIHQLDTGTFIKPDKTTLAEYLEGWLKDYAWPNLSPRTAEGYEGIIHTHLIPALGNIPLTELRPAHIQKYLTEKLSSGRVDGKGGLSPRSVQYHYITIHTALGHAVKWGLVVRNVADVVTPPHPQRHEIKVINEDEVNKFLDAAKNTEYYALFYTALFTGMRRSELLALK